MLSVLEYKQMPFPLLHQEAFLKEVAPPFWDIAFPELLLIRPQEKPYKETLSRAQRSRVNIQTTFTSWEQVSHMLWSINLQTNTNGFFITYVNIRYIRFELASSKARITSVKSLKQESVIQSESGTRVDIRVSLNMQNIFCDPSS